MKIAQTASISFSEPPKSPGCTEIAIEAFYRWILD